MAFNTRFANICSDVRILRCINVRHILLSTFSLALQSLGPTILLLQCFVFTTCQLSRCMFHKIYVKYALISNHYSFVSFVGMRVWFSSQCLPLCYRSYICLFIVHLFAILISQQHHRFLISHHIFRMRFVGSHVILLVGFGNKITLNSIYFMSNNYGKINQIVNIFVFSVQSEFCVGCEKRCDGYNGQMGECQSLKMLTLFASLLC